MKVRQVVASLGVFVVFYGGASAGAQEVDGRLTVTDYEFHSQALLPEAAISVTLLDVDPEAVTCTVEIGMASAVYRDSIGPVLTLSLDGVPRGYAVTWGNNARADVLGVGTRTAFAAVDAVPGLPQGAMSRHSIWTPENFREGELSGDVAFSIAAADVAPFPGGDPTLGDNSMMASVHCSEPTDIVLQASREVLVHSQATFDSSTLYAELAFSGNVVVGAESRRTFQGGDVEVAAGPGRITPQQLWDGALVVGGPEAAHTWNFFTDDWYWTRSGGPGTYTFKLDRRALGQGGQNLWLTAVAWEPVSDLVDVLELASFTGEGSR